MRHFFRKRPVVKEDLCLGLTVSPDLLCRAAAKSRETAVPFSLGQVLLLSALQPSRAPAKGGPR
ncbi:MAG: hypothetical protein HFG09_03450 [Oscillibacter sp.]|nr:hypothetical protein [Oscillibacter sp.]